MPTCPSTVTSASPPRERGVDRLRAHDAGAADAAVGLHDRQRRRDPSRTQPLHQARDVAPDERLHVGVEHGAHRALELPEDRQHLAGQRHRAVRVLLPEQRPGAPLVRRVGVAVQEAHRDRVHGGLAQPPGRHPHRGLVEGLQLFAVDGDAPVDLEDPLGRDRPRRLHPGEHVGAPGNVVAADLEHVTEAGGGEQARGRALGFQDGVGGGRRSVQDVAQRPGLHTGEPQRLVDAGHESVGRIVRCRRRLGDPEPAARFVHQRDVGERAADVEGDGVRPRAGSHRTLRGVPMTPSAKREKRNAERSRDGLPSRITSETRRPATGPIAKP